MSQNVTFFVNDTLHTLKSTSAKKEINHFWKILTRLNILLFLHRNFYY